MPNIVELLLKIVLSKLKVATGDGIGDTRFRFRKNSGQRKALFLVKPIREKYIENTQT